MALNRLLSYTTNPLAAVGAVFLFAYYETIVRVVRNMFSYQGSHGILILAVSLYMIWMKRSELRKALVKPRIGFGTVLTMAGFFVLLCGRAGNIVILEELSLLITLSGLVLLISGSRYFWILLLPLAYLVIMFPLFENIIGSFSFYLQLITAKIASGLLKLVGLPTYQSGIYLELPHITLSVARVCNGINHIVALVAVAVPLSFMTQQSLSRKVLFVLVAFLVGILSNGLRVALIGLWAIYHQGSLLHGPFDMLYIAFIFFFGLAVIFSLGFVSREKPFRPFSRRQQESRISLSQCAAGSSPSACESPAKKEAIMKSLGIGSWTALGIMLASLAFLHLWKPIPYSLKNPLSELPASIDGWVGRDISVEKDGGSLQPGDELLHRIYQDPSGRELEVTIVYYSYQSQDREITDFRYKWGDWPLQIVSLQLSDGELQVKKARGSTQGSRTWAYFWYDVNGRTLLSNYAVKGAIILDSLTKRRTSGALISIQVKSEPGCDQGKTADELGFIRDFFPIVREHLKQ